MVSWRREKKIGLSVFCWHVSGMVVWLVRMGWCVGEDKKIELGMFYWECVWGVCLALCLVWGEIKYLACMSGVRWGWWFNRMYSAGEESIPEAYVWSVVNNKLFWCLG